MGAGKVQCAHCGHKAGRKDMVKTARSLNFPDKWTCRNIKTCIENRIERDLKSGVIRK